MTDARTLSPRERTANGFVWVFDEAGAHFYQKVIPETRERISATETRIKPLGYKLMRVLPNDLVNGNFEFLCRHEMTNLNAVRTAGNGE